MNFKCGFLQLDLLTKNHCSLTECSVLHRKPVSSLFACFSFVMAHTKKPKSLVREECDRHEKFSLGKWNLGGLQNLGNTCFMNVRFSVVPRITETWRPHGLRRLRLPCSVWRTRPCCCFLGIPKGGNQCTKSQQLWKLSACSLF